MLSGELLGVEGGDEEGDDALVISTVCWVKIVSLRPMMRFVAGFCIHPASRAMKTTKAVSMKYLHQGEW